MKSNSNLSVNSPTPTPTHIYSSSLAPKGLAPRVVLILAIILPCVALLALCMGVLHYVGIWRRKEETNEKRHDLEAPILGRTLPNVELPSNLIVPQSVVPACGMFVTPQTNEVGYIPPPNQIYDPSTRRTIYLG